MVELNSQSVAGPTGIIIVDHGSRRAESNLMLEEVSRQFGERFIERFPIVEAAHMEIAEPSIATAYAKCVERGARRIMVTPFFLGPGKHWTSDIPRITSDAAAAFPDTRYHVTMPLGVDDLILDLLAKRADFCVQHDAICDSCRGTIRSGEPGIRASNGNAQGNGNGHAPSAPLQCSTCPFMGMPLPAAV